MSLPYRRVHFGPDATSPLDIPGTDFAWVTIPNTLIRSMVWDVGRSHELDQFRSGTATVVLKNNDRRFDPEHTAGPYFGKLEPRVPFRIQLSTDGATWADEFYGFVKDGWVQSYLKPSVSSCTVVLEDLLAVIEGEPLPRTAYEYEVLTDNPVTLWQLDETAGSLMTDSSGNGLHGQIDNGILGRDPLIVGEGNSFEVPHIGDSRGIYKGGALPQGPPCTIAAWVKKPREDLNEVYTIINIQRDLARNSFVALEIGPSTTSPNGELAVDFFFPTPTADLVARGHTRVDDDIAHYVAVTMASSSGSDINLWVDGVQQTKTVVDGTNGGNWTSHLWWTVGNIADDPLVDFGVGGLIDGVGIYSTALSGARMLAHYQAGATAFENEFSGTRINRVLDILGVPSALRDIATGDTTVGPADYGGETAGPYLQKVAESEGGVFFVDHRGGGKLKFRGRFARLTETRSTTSQATFTPKHFTEAIRPEPNGIATIVNVVEVTWRGGKETVSDDASRARYGPKSRSLNTEAPSASAARNSGAWVIGRYKNPQVRLRDLSLNLAGKPNLWPTVLNLRVSDRVSVERHPQKTGAAITNQVVIEGRRVEINEDLSWSVGYRLSNAEDADVWRWGVSQWGTETVWG